MTELNEKLRKAALKGQTAAVKRHLKAGAGVDPYLIHLVCEGKSVDVVRLLIEHGVDVNVGYSNKTTPLHWACSKCRTAIARLLLNAGADANAKDSFDATPLHYACNMPWNGDLDLIHLLLEHGADVNAKDRKNRIPIDMVLQLPETSPKREALLELFQEREPELYFTKFCEQGHVPGGI